MPEFRVILDGLELDEHEHAIVAQAVLEAGLKAVSNLARKSKAGSSEFAAISADQIVVEDWRIDGGWLLREALASRVRASLQEQGILPRELGGPLRRG